MSKVSVFIDMKELNRDIKKLKKGFQKIGDVPQKHVTGAARKGMTISLKQSKANAPYDTGMLKKGIVLKGENSRFKGKKVYRVVFDDKMNDVFQKPIKNPFRAKSKTAYYPFSQEYGFFARDGKYIPGFRFITDSLNDNVSKISRTMVDEMGKRIDQEIRKAGLK